MIWLVLVVWVWWFAAFRVLVCLGLISLCFGVLCDCVVVCGVPFLCVGGIAMLV